MTGTYTQITEIVAPSSAISGERVNIEVRVKNLASYPIYICISGRVNGLDLDFGSYYHSVPAGGIQSFYDAFIMGGHDVTLEVWSWYWTGTEWYQDDHATKEISVTQLAPVITGFEIDYAKV